jgi:hypothetical protein
VPHKSEESIQPHLFPSCATLFAHMNLFREQPCGIVRRPSLSCRREEARYEMLWTIFVILLVLWLLGVVSSYTLGGFIHILLVIALVVLLIQLISGRRPVV